MSVSTEIWKKINWERKGLRLPAVGCRAARLLVTGLFATRLSVILGLTGQERHKRGVAHPPRTTPLNLAPEFTMLSRSLPSRSRAEVKAPHLRLEGVSR